MAPAPQWAQELLAEVSAAEGIKAPELTWRRSARHVSSSGHCALMGHYIVVTAGRDRKDQRDTLLHELAHAIRWQRGQERGGHHHDEDFYLVLFALFERYSTSTWKRHLEREGGYMSTALKVAQDLGIRGAKAAAARRKPKP